MCVTSRVVSNYNRAELWWKHRYCDPKKEKKKTWRDDKITFRQFEVKFFVVFTDWGHGVCQGWKHLKGKRRRLGNGSSIQCPLLYSQPVWERTSSPSSFLSAGYSFSPLPGVLSRLSCNFTPEQKRTHSHPPWFVLMSYLNPQNSQNSAGKAVCRG